MIIKSFFFQLVSSNEDETLNVSAKAKRFCDEIRKNNLPFTKYFKSVFKNPTFRVYKLL
jgi:hypothetical protein